MTIEDFKRKYGSRMVRLLVESYIERNPSNDTALALRAKEIQAVLHELEKALESVKT